MPLYGCQLWDFSGKHVELFYTAWRKAIRKVWRLPYRSHCHLPHLICNDMDIEVQLHKRFLKFLHKAYHSGNVVTETLSKLVLQGSRSSVGNSVNYILHKYDILKSEFSAYSVPDLLSRVDSKVRQIPLEMCALANAIRELCEVRDGNWQSNLTQKECRDLADLLCVA